jgi:hypothetical protein
MMLRTISRPSAESTLIFTAPATTPHQSGAGLAHGKDHSSRGKLRRLM